MHRAHFCFLLIVAVSATATAEPLHLTSASIAELNDAFEAGEL